MPGKPRKRPNVRVREASGPDGAPGAERIATWHEAFGNHPASYQALLEYSHLHNEVLRRESDRAVAVLGPAYADAILEDLLRAFLIEGKSADALLAVEGALGTFSSRINLAHALGLIRDSTHHDLELLRRIRNDFAHKVDLHSLEEEPSQNRTREFAAFKRWDPPPNEPTSRGRFLFGLFCAINDILESMARVARQAPAAPPTFGPS
jgi:hypothetical protein